MILKYDAWNCIFLKEALRADWRALSGNSLLKEYTASALMIINMAAHLMIVYRLYRRQL